MLNDKTPVNQPNDSAQTEGFPWLAVIFALLGCVALFVCLVLQFLPKFR